MNSTHGQPRANGTAPGSPDGNMSGLTKENLLSTFPLALRESASIAALGDVTMEVLAERPAEIGLLSLYPRIDELPEDLLDILACDFKVDWWDPNYSLEEKRRVFKDSWYVHKHMGTKAAVETAIRAIYPLTTVEEWFEYEGGEPYHFRLRINITSDSGDRERQKRVLERLNFYKNLRSHVDEIKYFLMPEKSWALAGGAYVGSREIARAKIIVPPLKKPGGEVIAIAGGGLAGSRSEGRVAINVPPLQRLGGKTIATAGGVFTGGYSRDHASIQAPPLRKAGGSFTASAGGAFTGSRRKMEAAVAVPELAKPLGAAERAAAAGCIGAVERAAVRLRPDNIRIPTGRAAPGGSAGVFHIYQRITREVTINGTLEGRGGN